MLVAGVVVVVPGYPGTKPERGIWWVDPWPDSFSDTVIQADWTAADCRRYYP